MDAAHTLFLVVQGPIFAARGPLRARKRRGFANYTEQILRIGFSGGAVPSGSNRASASSLVNPISSCAGADFCGARTTTGEEARGFANYTEQILRIGFSDGAVPSGSNRASAPVWGTRACRFVGLGGAAAQLQPASMAHLPNRVAVSATASVSAHTHGATIPSPHWPGRGSNR
jgi:hypothetical protein